MSDDSMVLAAAAVAITTICAGVVAHHDPDPPETKAPADAVTGPAALSGGNPETRKLDCRQISAGEYICKLEGAENASNDD